MELLAKVYPLKFIHKDCATTQELEYYFLSGHRKNTKTIPFYIWPFMVAKTPFILVMAHTPWIKFLKYSQENAKTGLLYLAHVAHLVQAKKTYQTS